MPTYGTQYEIQTSSRQLLLLKPASNRKCCPFLLLLNVVMELLGNYFNTQTINKWILVYLNIIVQRSWSSFNHAQNLKGIWQKKPNREKTKTTTLRISLFTQHGLISTKQSLGFREGRSVDRQTAGEISVCVCVGGGDHYENSSIFFSLMSLDQHDLHQRCPKR